MATDVRADLRNLATGVEAWFFDGQSPIGSPIVLTLNLSSLSQRVSVEALDQATRSILFSCNIQEFRVLNSRARATRAKNGELWLKHKTALLLIDQDNPRLAFLGWLHQFAKSAVWRDQSNFALILLATALNLGLFLAVSMLSGLLVESAIKWLSPSTLKPTIEQWSELVGQSYCDDAEAYAIVDATARRMLPGTSTAWQIVWRPSDPQPLKYLGGDIVDLNVAALQDIDDPEILGAAILLTLTRQQQRTVDLAHAERIAQTVVGQYQQMGLFASLLPRLYGWVTMAYESRRRTLSADDQTLANFASAGIRARGLIAYLEWLESHDAEGLFPTIFQQSPSAAKRLAIVRSKMDQAVFMPSTGSPSFSKANFDQLKASCHISSN